MRRRAKLTPEERRKLMTQSQLSRCKNPELVSVVERNMETIDEHRREIERSKTIQDHLADAITRCSGSLPFVYFHVVFFALWILANSRLAGIPAFDPYPFGMLTTIVSLEAIFLASFVLVSQNRQDAISERRTELDLQINLLTEYEVTRILTLVDRIAKRLDVNNIDTTELKELEKVTRPEALLQELGVRAENHANGKADAQVAERQPSGKHSKDKRPESG